MERRLMPQSGGGTRGGRTSRKKVKSGCRTCKARKVKCDEAFPACRRCLTTGRTCDGYGIWGGGGTALPSPANSGHQLQGIATHKSCTSGPTVACPSFISPAVATEDETVFFHWFQARTSSKLPGSFSSDFWSTLLLQASFGEPAIFHAVLALSSVHKRGVLRSERDEMQDIVPDKLEQFALHHYLESISHLQHHFTSGRDKPSCRIALIACIVFVTMDFLRGHFSAGQVHLHNGLKLLQQTYAGHSLLISAIDEWIIEVFSRLYFQVRLFNQQSRTLFRPQVLRASTQGNPSPVFQSHKEAWHEIEGLLGDTFLLTDKARHLQSETSGPHHDLTILERQQQVRHRAAQWLSNYESWTCPTVRKASMVDTRAWHLLRSYHTMVTIMVEVAVHPDDEGLFDAHTSEFLLLLEQLGDLRNACSAWLPYPAPPRRNLKFDMSRSIIDLGWIPPLFFTAAKCRVHTIRLRAIRLLESTSHREGIWDANILARVGRRVIELEEQDYFAHADTKDVCSSSGSSSTGELYTTALPTSYRIRNLEVSLSGDPISLITLRFNRERNFDKTKLIIYL